MSGGSKHKDFVDAILIVPCQNSWQIMGWMIYGEGGTQITPSLPTNIDPLEQDLGQKGSILI